MDGQEGHRQAAKPSSLHIIRCYSGLRRDALNLLLTGAIEFICTIQHLISYTHRNQSFHEAKKKLVGMQQDHKSQANEEYHNAIMSFLILSTHFVSSRAVLVAVDFIRNPLPQRDNTPPSVGYVGK